MYVACAVNDPCNLSGLTKFKSYSQPFWSQKIPSAPLLSLYYQLVKHSGYQRTSALTCLISNLMELMHTT